MCLVSYDKLTMLIPAVSNKNSTIFPLRASPACISRITISSFIFARFSFFVFTFIFSIIKLDSSY